MNDCRATTYCTMLKLSTLGGLSLEGNAGPLSGAATRRRPLALLALLSVAGDRGVSRDKLLVLLWPDSETERARSALNQTLFSVRRDLRAPTLVLGTSQLRLNPEVISSDVAEFEAALDRGELERAVALYRGPFLDGFHPPGQASEFERWVEAERARLTQRASAALKTLATEAMRRGDYEVSAAWWRCLAALDPLNGRVAVGLMEALVAAGDRAGALQHFRVYEALLRQELDSPPDQAASALAERLRRAPVFSRPEQGSLSPPDTPEGPPARPEKAAAVEADGPTLPRDPRILAGRYEVERELGRGAMAIVYLARDLKYGRQVAVKVLDRELAAGIGSERFLREIRLAASLQHPHILPLYDSGEVDGALYYVMPYIEGESLRQRLERERQLPVEDALRITREVASALDYAHGRGVIHRDVKPENILLSGGHAVVADFGIARAIGRAGGERLTDTGLAVGTPTYMSPEQASGERAVDGRSDLYSLGCVVYEMLAGQPPFMGPTPQAVIAQRFTDPPPKLRQARDSVAEGVESAIAKALARVPADRFPTARVFAEALLLREVPIWTEPGPNGPAPQKVEPLVASDEVAVVPSGTARPRLCSFRWWLPVGAAALVLALAGAVLSSLKDKDEQRLSDRLDPRLVVVAPFAVFERELELWREGMADVLARNLDGAGPLRTVSPRVVVRRWRGPPDRESAAELGRATGARIVLFGRLLRAGQDSVRATATLVDAATGRVLGEVERREALTRMDRLTDSLSVSILQELGERFPIDAVRSTPRRFNEFSTPI